MPVQFVTPKPLQHQQQSGVLRAAIGQWDAALAQDVAGYKNVIHTREDSPAPSLMAYLSSPATLARQLMPVGLFMAIDDIKEGADGSAAHLDSIIAFGSPKSDVLDLFGPANSDAPAPPVRDRNTNTSFVVFNHQFLLASVAAKYSKYKPFMDEVLHTRIYGAEGPRVTTLPKPVRAILEDAILYREADEYNTPGLWCCVFCGIGFDCRKTLVGHLTGGACWRTQANRVRATPNPSPTGVRHARWLVRLPAELVCLSCPEIVENTATIEWKM